VTVVGSGEEEKEDTEKDEHGGTENTELHRAKTFRYGKEIGYGGNTLAFDFVFAFSARA